MKSFPCRNDLIILALLCFISFFVYRDVVELDLMEARNFVTAREMVTENNWLVPTMNGEIRLAKPPMPTWFAALCAKVAGNNFNLGVLRLPNALAACLLVFSAYGLSFAVGRNRRLAFLTAAMLATSVLAIGVGRTGSWDIFCHAFMVAALWGLWAGLENRGGWPAFILAGIFLGLSFMSKGPVAFFALFLPFAIAYGYFYGLASIRREWPGLTLALILCLLLSLWWPLYILAYHADLGLMVADKEKDAWASRHVQPFWYYWHFLVFSGGWLVWALAALFRPYATRRSESKKAHGFFLLWLAAALILLSLVPEKKERYLLPAMIPLFLLAGGLADRVVELFNRHREQPADRALVLVHTSVLSLLALTLPFVLGILLRKQGQQIDGVVLAYGIAFWGVAFLLLRFHRHRQVERLLLTSMAFLGLTTLAVLHYYGPLSYTNRAYKTIDRPTLAREIGDTKIYLLGDQVDMRIIFDLGRRAYPWQAAQVSGLLESGQPVAVLSKGDPLPLLPEALRQQVSIRLIDSFDYSKKRPDKRRIHLAVLHKRVLPPS